MLGKTWIAGQIRVCNCSVVSDSLWPQGLKPIRIFCLRSFQGKNIGVGCHFLLQEIFPAQGSSSHLLLLLHWQVHSLPLSPQEDTYSCLEFLMLQTMIGRLKQLPTTPSSICFHVCEGGDLQLRWKSNIPTSRCRTVYLWNVLLNSFTKTSEYFTYPLGT